jgi:DNA-binding MarR family transcriptional regulator
MAVGQRSGPPVPADVMDLESALTRIAHLMARAKQHHSIAVEADVPVDRAAVPILRLLADSGPLRTSELAVRLAVEAPHITRQVHRLEELDYLERVADPGDRRAHRVQLTRAGLDAADRIAAVSQRRVQHALAHWSPQDREQLAILFHRMVDDFLANAPDVGLPAVQAGHVGSGSRPAPPKGTA